MNELQWWPFIQGRIAPPCDVVTKPSQMAPGLSVGLDLAFVKVSVSVC